MRNAGLVTTTLAFALVLAACASVNRMAGPSRSVFMRGVNGAPYRADIVRHFVNPEDTARIGILPVAMGPSVTRAELSPDGRSALLELLELRTEMEQSLGRFSGVRPVGWTDPPGERPPEVYLGVAGGSLYPVSGLEMNTTMQFYVLDCYPGWRQALTALAARERLDYMVFVALSVGRFSPTAGLFKSELQLGTGHTLKLSTLRTMFGEASVQVVTLNAALVDAGGHIVRVAGEGIVCPDPAVRPSSSLTVGEDLSDVLRDRPITTLVRDELPGKPLAWEVAMGSLLASLTGRETRLSGER